jgi:hypothetical protein
MGQLDKSQLRFLKDQGVALSQVFDASGLSTSERRQRMEALEKKFYFGGTACRAAGHTLRTKAGHCIQCDTSKIAYQLRSSQGRHVYVAYSNEGACAKVGTTSLEPEERIYSLCASDYGGFSDWRLVDSRYLAMNAGAAEFSVHAELEPFQSPVGYYKTNDMWVECREIFFCECDDVAHVFARVIAQFDG